MTAPPKLFDSALIRARRDRAADGFDAAAFLHAEAARRLIERLDDLTRRFPRIAIFGDGGGLGDALRARGGVETVLTLDPSPAMAARAAPPSVAAAIDAPPLATGSFDAVLSLFLLQAVDDIPGALAQIRRALKPDGLFLAAVLGGDSLNELRVAALAADAAVTSGASPRVAPALDLRDAAGLLQRAGFALPVADLDRITVDYADVFGLIRDLRAAGATNPRADRLRRPTPRAFFGALAQSYAEANARPDGRVTATADLLWLTGWAPAETQQKALRPGSGKASLADALGGGR